MDSILAFLFITIPWRVGTILSARNARSVGELDWLKKIATEHPNLAEDIANKLRGSHQGNAIFSSITGWSLFLASSLLLNLFGHTRAPTIGALVGLVLGVIVLIVFREHTSPAAEKEGIQHPFVSVPLFNERFLPTWPAATFLSVLGLLADTWLVAIRAAKLCSGT